MNAITRRKAFRVDDGFAVMLPAMPGLGDGTELDVVVAGPDIVVRPVLPSILPEEVRRRMDALYADLRAIGPIARDPAHDDAERIEFPDRPRL